MTGRRRWSAAAADRNMLPAWKLRRRGQLVFAVSLLLLAGCQWIRQRVCERSDECSELCARAREAQMAGRRDQADDLLDAAKQRHATDVEARKELAETLLASGRFDEAAAEYERLLQSTPHDLKLRLDLARTEVQRGQLDAACEQVDRALARQPQSTAALQLKAELEAAKGRLDDALATYAALARLTDDDSDVLIQQAELHLKLNRPDLAAPLLRTALGDRRCSREATADAEWLLARAYAMSGRWDDARRHMARGLELRPPTKRDAALLAQAEEWLPLNPNRPMVTPLGDVPASGSVQFARDDRE